MTVGYFCHRHGVQSERPCPKCKRRRQTGKALMQRREQVISLYGGRCAALLKDGSHCEVRAPLELHHFDGNVENNALSNQIPLCKEHHLSMAHADRSEFAEPVRSWIG